MNKQTAVLNALKKSKAGLSIAQLHTKCGCAQYYDVIKKLRKNHVIELIMKQGKDCFGNKCSYGVYVYMGEKKKAVKE